MKKFLFLTYGFEPPTPAIMQAWGRWFEELGDRVVERAHLPRGREISKAGVRDLPLGPGATPDAITGFVIVRAASFEEAERLAASNPFITSIRLYELAGG